MITDSTINMRQRGSSHHKTHRDILWAGVMLSKSKIPESTSMLFYLFILFKLALRPARYPYFGRVGWSAPSAVCAAIGLWFKFVRTVSQMQAVTFKSIESWKRYLIYNYTQAWC